ncbi:alpha-galactosidase [Diaporthe amygdali]|uniref:alpha-galactosidase n=1 Tax=Phomopsis amygdali TaxID=1214568 RepID=UPI0022FE76F3|nr:alpha-galactosidase [Diaporthe amygdali]KAJ0117324.1 alpha-galactosidase [Diaporthe amygdali]
MMLVAIAQLLLASHVTAGFNPPGVLSPLPPMGFNNWARYMGGLNESLFVDTAEAMIAKGLLTAGYNRLNLDDEWSLMERLPNGSMAWDEAKFPRGLPWLTDFIKSKGFIPGIYTDAGNKSCGGYPGAYGYEEIDARDFVDWGFEYLKLDGCNMPDTTEGTYRRVYGKWHDILSAMWPKQMIFSESAPAYFAEAANLTSWYAVMEWVPQYGELARHSRDSLVWNSTNYWPDITGWDSVLFNYGQEVRLARFQRPGYFNDPDFLNVDHFDYTLTEKKSHFALWCSLSAPLILSTDLLNITDAEVEYLTNRDLIAVDQDPLVQQATLVSQDGIWDVLTKSLYNGDRLVTMLNRGNVSGDIQVSWARIGIFPDELPTPSSINVKDLWTGQTTTVSLDAGGIKAIAVPSRGTAVFRLSNPSVGDGIRTFSTGLIFNTFSLNCLTHSLSGFATWSKCRGSDAQVWKVRPDGHISSLSSTKQCLAVDSQGQLVSRETGCAAGKENRWDYFVSGNLINAASGLCVTESQTGVVDGNATATVARCGYLTNEQVVALPVGVAL